MAHEETYMAKKEVEKARRQLRRWGLQTVSFAMNVQAKEHGKLKDDVTFRKATSSKAETVTKQLWHAARTESSRPFNPSEFGLIFARKILDWCAKHRQSSGIAW